LRHVSELIHNTADGAFALDQRQRIVIWNRSAAAILGCRARDVIGRKCFEVVGGRDASGSLVCCAGCHVFEAAQRARPAPVTEVCSETPVGRRLWLSMSTIIIGTPRGPLSLLVHLFRERTERHELMGAVRMITDAVRRAPRARSPAAPAMRATTAAPDLTRREREVIAHLIEGESTSAIAEKLFVSQRTVRNHITSILAKLGVHSRLEAVTYCLREGLV